MSTKLTPVTPLSAAAPAASNRHTTKGIACGMGAGALWGLVFLAPELAGAFSPLYLAIGRYLCYGLVALLLLRSRWRLLAGRITTREWRTLAWLALLGNTLYYILMASAVQMGGVTMTSLVLGFMPVAVTIIGSRDRNAVPLKQLLLSLFLCIAGAVCIGWQALESAASGTLWSRFGGLCYAIGALASWTTYAVANARYLSSAASVSAHDWSLLIGIVTGAQSLLLIPAAIVMGENAHSLDEWLQFAGISAGLAFLASIAGNALWNRMSQLLPLTLVGQMILFETAFALLYGLLWEQRLPTLLEALAFTLVVLSVLSCIAAHRTSLPFKESAPA